LRTKDHGVNFFSLGEKKYERRKVEMKVEEKEENEVAKDKETTKEEHEVEKERTMKRAKKISKRR
jgi:hypothetical protein